MWWAQMRNRVIRHFSLYQVSAVTLSNTRSYFWYSICCIIRCFLCHDFVTVQSVTVAQIQNVVILCQNFTTIVKPCYEPRDHYISKNVEKMSVKLSNAIVKISWHYKVVVCARILHLPVSSLHADDVSLPWPTEKWARMTRTEILNKSVYDILCLQCRLTYSSVPYMSRYLRIRHGKIDGYIYSSF